MSVNSISTSQLANKHQILRITLYVLHGFESAETSYGASQEYGQHSSIRKYYGKPHLEKLIEREIVDRRGQLLVTSTYASIIIDTILTLEQLRSKAICKIKFKRW